MKLLKVDTLVQARERLLKAAKECLPETEQVALADASDRILAEDIVSGGNDSGIPPFQCRRVCSLFKGHGGRNGKYPGFSEGAGRSRDRASGGIKD